MSVTFWTEKESLGINLSNGNADDLMRFVGLTPEWAGTIKARELLVLTGRALIREAGIVDPARPRSTQRGPGGVLMIECGRRAGYLTQRAPDLHALALAAAESDGDVHWG